MRSASVIASAVQCIFVAAATVSVGGCLEDAEPVATGEQSIRSAGGAEKDVGDGDLIATVGFSDLFLGKCKGPNCGGNGVILDFPFHELNADGLPNDHGLRIAQFLSPANDKGIRERLTLVVERDVLKGIDPKGNELAGPALIGARIVLAVDGPAEGVPVGYELDLGLDSADSAAIGSTSYWIGDRGSVPTYRFSYRSVAADGTASDSRSMCDDAASGGYALIFQGDGYVASSIVVFNDPWVDWSHWFNVACLGTPISKMHLTRHTSAGSDATHTTNVGQRQAFLKMLTADYCGIGHSFTHTGVPLRYITNQGWVIRGGAPDLTRQTIDAVWNQDGLVCINRPRLTYEVSDHDAEYLAQMHDIANTCHFPSSYDIPRCEGTDWADPAVWGRLGYVLSSNPLR